MLQTRFFLAKRWLSENACVRVWTREREKRERVRDLLSFSYSLRSGFSNQLMEAIRIGRRLACLDLNVFLRNSGIFFFPPSNRSLGYEPSSYTNQDRLAWFVRWPFRARGNKSRIDFKTQFLHEINRRKFSVWRLFVQTDILILRKEILDASM